MKWLRYNVPAKNGRLTQRLSPSSIGLAGSAWHSARTNFGNLDRQLHGSNGTGSMAISKSLRNYQGLNGEPERCFFNS